MCMCNFVSTFRFIHRVFGQYFGHFYFFIDLIIVVFLYIYNNLFEILKYFILFYQWLSLKIAEVNCS